MVKCGIETAPISSGKLNDKKACRRTQPSRYFTTAVISGVLLAIGALSWVMLYVANVNVGD